MNNQENQMQFLKNLEAPLEIVEDQEFLRQKSGHCFSEEVAFNVLKALREKTEEMRGACMGLAAIQIGIPLRIGYLKIRNREILLVNPEIVRRKNKMVFGREGCMSIPGERLNTWRDNEIIVKDDSEDLARKFTGVEAQAVQHEIDHMDGILLLDREVSRENYAAARRTAPKNQRNKPCRCGSGKKTKKCCGVDS